MHRYAQAPELEKLEAADFVINEGIRGEIEREAMVVVENELEQVCIAQIFLFSLKSSV